MKYIVRGLLFGVVPMVAAFSAAAAENVDANAAIKVARSEHCLRCHAVNKKKEGPPYKVIADFYRSNPDAEQVIYEHVTTGAMVKLTDGHKENHKAILDKSPEQIKNLVHWILSQ
ncbi:MAG TPA: c-type cytochrome [Rhodocyclaceae bacterium]